MEKSISLKFRSEEYYLRIRCSPLKDQGRRSQIFLTSTSCLKENIKTFLSITSTSTSLMVFQALAIISLTTNREKTFVDKTFPNRISFAFSFASGSMSRERGCLDQPSLLVFAINLSIKTIDKKENQQLKFHESKE